MNTLLMPLGWMFAAIAALFALGLMPRFAHRFYPTSPPLGVRLVAPVIFALLALACIHGFGLQALTGVAAVGIVLMVATRRKRRGRAA